MNIHNKKRKNENERSKTGIRNRKRKQVKSAQKTGDDIVHNCVLISEKDCAIL